MSEQYLTWSTGNLFFIDTDKIANAFDHQVCSRLDIANLVFHLVRGHVFENSK